MAQVGNYGFAIMILIIFIFPLKRSFPKINNITALTIIIDGKIKNKKFLTTVIICRLMPFKASLILQIKR